MKAPKVKLLVDLCENERIRLDGDQNGWLDDRNADIGPMEIQTLDGEVMITVHLCHLPYGGTQIAVVANQVGAGITIVEMSIQKPSQPERRDQVIEDTINHLIEKALKKN